MRQLSDDLVGRYAMRSTTRGLRYTCRGDGQPVILLHGWCLNRTLWSYQEAALAASHQVISVDLPGFGESRDLAGPYNLDRYVDELAFFITELDLERVSIVGFAFGAAVAMALAARGDQRPTDLVLIGVPSASHAPYDRMKRAMRRDWPDFAAKSAQAICKQPQSDATLRWLGDMFRDTPLPVALETADLLDEFEPVPLAGKVTARALLVHGEHDDIVPVTVSAECARLMTHGTLLTVPESGHLVVLDQHSRLNEILREFLDR
jgi:pimeloyl-ACP methyl ester carboxylesterase